MDEWAVARTQYLSLALISGRLSYLSALGHLWLNPQQAVP